MSSRSIRRAAALAVLAVCALAPVPARAERPDTYDHPAKPAAVDSSRVLPHWLHLHAAIGVGWLSSPLAIRQLYQACQGYEVGLEARPRRDWRLRFNGEYQALPLVIDGEFRFVHQSGIDGEVSADTVRLEGNGQGWIGSGRFEAQKALIPGFWVLGGAGGGYLTSGLNAVNVLGTSFSFEGVLPGVSGWVLMPTMGAIAETDFLGPTLGIEVRWTGILMPDQAREHLQTWSIRFGWSGY
jgi:hypothetical protein